MQDHPYVVPFVVACVWILSCLWSSVAYGWWALTSRFVATSKPSGQTQSSRPFLDMVYWRLASRDPFVRITAANDALYIAMLPLLRPFHPSLRVPWDEIQMENGGGYLGSGSVLLILGKVEMIPLTLSRGTAQRLGIIERVPNIRQIDEPNFDNLSEGFIESMNERFKFK